LEAKSPILLHCSAGVGRTGTFIAIDIILDHIQRCRAGKNKSLEPSINVAALVFELRKQRRNMIQNKMQYRFICDFVAHCARTGELLDSMNMLVTPIGSSRDRSNSKKQRVLYSTRSSAQSFFGNFNGPSNNNNSSSTSEAIVIEDEVTEIDESIAAPTVHSSRGSFFKSNPLRDGQK